MKKYFISLLSVSAFPFVTAQKKEQLNNYFEAQHQKNINQLSALINVHKDVVKNPEADLRLSSVTNNNMPVFIQNEDARANNSSNITAVQSGSISGLNGFVPDGSGLKIMVMDGGKIFEKHAEFGGPTPAVPRIFDKENGEMSYTSHSTNVAGMIGAQGTSANAIGVLPKVLIDNYTYLQTSNGTLYTKLNNAGANISNHSYGVNVGWYKNTVASSYYPNIGFYWVGDYTVSSNDTYSGGYHAEDQNYDMIVYANPDNIVVKSTGNYYGIGPTASDKKYKWDAASNSYVEFASTDILPASNCSNGYNCIGWGALAKNIITVQAANQLSTSGNLYTSPADVTKYSSGSAGPRRDGGIKPDITAVGVSVYMPSYVLETNATSYTTNGSGTSFAAAHISGIAGALTQIQQNLSANPSFIFKADEMKALLTHTANEAGRPGPDVWFGWGLADAKKAAELLINKKDNKATFERNTLYSGTVYSKSFVSDGTPLKATISWVDPAATPIADNQIYSNTASTIVNDLDLRLIDTTDNTVYYPWKLNTADYNANAIKGDNTVDNVEQVLIDAPVSGRTYRLEVSNKGTLVNKNSAAATTDYALIVTGYQRDASLSSAATDLNKLVAVYPAKTKDFVTVIVPGKADFITLHDLSGKQIMKNSAKATQILDVSTLAKGVYIITVKTEKGTVSTKIIKE